MILELGWALYRYQWWKVFAYCFCLWEALCERVELHERSNCSFGCKKRISSIGWAWFFIHALLVPRSPFRSFLVSLLFSLVLPLYLCRHRRARILIFCKATTYCALRVMNPEAESWFMPSMAHTCVRTLPQFVPEVRTADSFGRLKTVLREQMICVCRFLIMHGVYPSFYV